MVNVKKYKYKIIEYGYTSITDSKVEYCKTLHKTNSKILYLLIILCLKINRIKYEVIINE